MFRRKDEVPIKRIVWHMNAVKPAGAYLRPSDPAQQRSESIELPEFGWSATRLDFLKGVRVSETPMDGLPAELIEAFAKGRR